MMLKGLYTTLKNNDVKGTVREISRDYQLKRRQCPTHNGTLKSFVGSSMNNKCEKSIFFNCGIHKVTKWIKIHTIYIYLQM